MSDRRDAGGRRRSAAARVAAAFVVLVAATSTALCGPPEATNDARSGAGADDASAGWLELFSPGLHERREETRRVRAALEALGPVVLGPTAPELGSQYLMHVAPPGEAPWVRIDLGEETAIDRVAVVPAILAAQPGGRGAYALPPRYRVDASNDREFATFITLGEAEDDGVASGLPRSFAATNLNARYVRLTAERLALEAEHWTFALSEIVVLRGRRNVAIGAAVEAPRATGLPPIWSKTYLVDGRTPLGPPIAEPLPAELPIHDGLFTRPPTPEAENWLTIDLGASRAIDEVRLHPVHARQGADFPGYSFPERFAIVLSETEDFANATVVHDSGDATFSNPGNNPVTIPLGAARGRFVRVRSLRPSRPDGSFGLSEIQVYSGDENAARGRPATAAGDVRERSTSLLTDGYASYGRLIELPEWLDAWRKRRELSVAASRLTASLAEAELAAQQRATWAATALAIAALVGAATLFAVREWQRRRALETLRRRLARDVHDEIGSNLAAIARLGEVAGDEAQDADDKADWATVRHLALDCAAALRETLWLIGAREQSSIDALDGLRRLAARMLPGAERRFAVEAVDWAALGAAARGRELYLALKEIFANIAAHSRASEVEFSVARIGDRIAIRVRDDGVGFDVRAARHGMGLANVQRRVKALGGRTTIKSEPGAGTEVELQLPARAPR